MPSSVHNKLWKRWSKEGTINYCRSYFSEKQDSHPRNVLYHFLERTQESLWIIRIFLLEERQYSKKMILIFIDWISERDWISLIYKGLLWECCLCWLAAIIAHLSSYFIIGHGFFALTLVFQLLQRTTHSFSLVIHKNCEVSKPLSVRSHTWEKLILYLLSILHSFPVSLNICYRWLSEDDVKLDESSEWANTALLHHLPAQSNGVLHLSRLSSWLKQTITSRFFFFQSAETCEQA